MIVELSVVPIGVGESLSSYVARVLEIIKKHNLKYELNPMGTVIELENFKQLAELLEDMDKTLFDVGSPRNYYVIKIDHRGKGGKMEDKVRSVLEKTK